MENSAFHEIKLHGSADFPYTVYNVGIPRFIRSFPLHWHDAAEIIYVTDGRGSITVDFKHYTVSSGDIIIIMPQSVHSIEQLDNNAMEYYNILFEFSLLYNSTDDVRFKKFFKPLLDNAIQPPVHVPKSDPFRNILFPHIEYLTENRKSRYSGDELMVVSHLLEIMSAIIKHSAPTSEAEISVKNSYDKVKKVLIKIQTDFDKEITVKEAAEICMYSPSYFMRIFKELTGSSFTQYLLDYRLNAAAKHLSTGDRQITDIAYDCGFNNLSYFTRAFVRKFGKTPTEYKKTDNRPTVNP